MKSKIACFLIAAVVICGHAFAHKIDLPLPPDPKAQATATAAAQSTSNADSTANSTATGGNGTGGSSNLSFNAERSAPSLAQGGLFVGDCGAGGNAGGSNSNGAGFLGISWTPKDCKLLLAAQAFHAIGMSDEACRMIVGISAVKARYKELGIDPPDCLLKKAITVTSVPVKPDLSNYVTRSELMARDKVLLEKATSK